MSAESLVELRSSDDSSSFHIFGAEGKTYDFRPHATAREIFKAELMKPSLGNVIEGVSSSMSNANFSKKSQPNPKAAVVAPPKKGKGTNSGIPNKPKNKSKEKYSSKDSSIGTKKSLTINTSTSNLNQQREDTRVKQRSTSRHSASPQINQGGSSSSSQEDKPPSLDRETARHTSKDTIMTSNL